MTPEYYELLSPYLKQLTDEIETYCGFEIDVVCNPQLPVRGRLSHSPRAITIELRDDPPTPAVLCHELCHADRYFRKEIPLMRFQPPRLIHGLDGSTIDAADNLDNMLEHILVLRDMKERFGFDKDPTHVITDISSYAEWPEDPFSRRCLALCNATLVHFHFPELSSDMDDILARENLIQVTQSLVTELESSLESKPRMVAALLKALELDFADAELRRRNVSAGCDVGAPLLEWLNVEQR